MVRTVAVTSSHDDKRPHVAIERMTDSGNPPWDQPRFITAGKGRLASAKGVDNRSKSVLQAARANGDRLENEVRKRGGRRRGGDERVSRVIFAARACELC